VRRALEALVDGDAEVRITAHGVDGTLGEIARLFNRAAERAGRDRKRTSALIEALHAVEQGRLAVRLPVDEQSGEPAGGVAAAFNQVAERAEALAAEVIRVAREVGTE
jgi:methyl-accepting chemotaxis protein